MGDVNGVRALDLIDRVVGGEDAKVVIGGIGEGRKEDGKEDKDDLRERAERFLRGDNQKK